MAGRRRGARSGRGWDAAPPPSDRARRASSRSRRRAAPATSADDGWGDESAWPEGATPARPAADSGRRSDGSPEGDISSRPAAGRRPVAGGEPGAAREATWRDPAELARDICLKLLAVRPRTRAELAANLRRKGIPPEVAAEVLERYDEVGIVDDAAFARAWISSRHHGQGLARRALANELRRRGVDSDTVGAALEDLDTDTEAATARTLVDRKMRTIAGANPTAAFRRLVGMLARKGYSPGVAIRVVKDALAAQGAEAAEFAEQIDAEALADVEPEAAGAE